MNIERKQIFPPMSVCVYRLIERKKIAGRERTAANYRSAWKKFAAFLGRKARGLAITDMTEEMTQEYLMWLLQDEKSGNIKLTPGSQDFYLRNLKAIYNNIKKDLHYRESVRNPFDGLSITVPTTRKRALPERDIKRLANLDLSGKPDHLAALHLSLFLFYARGMCFVDAFKLEKENVHNGYLQYKRSKTQVILQVKITAEMYKIILYHKKNNCRWVFPFLHEKLLGNGPLTAQSSLHRINGYMKEIGDELGLPYPLTTYVMRHSWASLMLEAGSEIGVISQSLGHMSLQTTEIYLGQLSKSKMDRASEKMLNHHVRMKPIRKIKAKGKANSNRSNKIIINSKQPSGSKWRNILTSLATKLLLFAKS